MSPGADAPRFPHIALLAMGVIIAIRQWLYPIPSSAALAGWIYVYVSATSTSLIGSGIWVVAGIAAYLVWARVTKQWPFALADYREVEDLDWTYVSPAALIHPGERTGRYRLDGDQVLVDESGSSEISAEDYAIAIADLIEQDTHARERVRVAW